MHAGIGLLPEYFQAAIQISERNNTFDSYEFEQANAAYYSNFIRRKYPSLKPGVNFNRAEGNRRMYKYMWGPSEFTATGTLRNYDRLDRLDDINVPVLWITGEYDEARPSTVKYYHSLTPVSTFEIVHDAAHATMSDNQEENVALIREFLDKLENKKH